VKEETIAVAFSYPMLFDGSMPGLVDRGYEGVELFDVIRAGQLHFHEAIVETLRNAGKFMDVCCCDGKSHSCLPPLFAAASAPKICVAATVSVSLPLPSKRVSLRAAIST